MAEKKFKVPEDIPAVAGLAEDHRQAERFDTVKVGRLGVYFRDGLRIRFVPYSYLERVFIRIQEVNARVCCGSMPFYYYRLVLVHSGREYADVLSESEDAMDSALALIHERVPELAIGVAEKRAAAEQR